MDPNQLNVLSYPNWLGNVDFNLMYKTYLGDCAETERRTGDPIHKDDDINWWEKNREDWPQIHSSSSAESEGGLHFIPDANTEFSNSGFEVELPKQPEGDYDAFWSHRGSSWNPAEEIFGATGFFTTGEEGGPLESPFLSTGSGSRTPDVPVSDSASDEQESCEDLALEHVCHYLDTYEGSECFGLPEEPLQLTGDHLLGPSGAPDTVESQCIPASEVLFKMQASRKHRVRGPKNWEFLMRLLVDPRTNPALIEWEDEEQGIFRLRNPKVIAQIWASRNENTTDLSYNNFARGLRHHYKKGILIPIPERQLVYQCGQQALEFLNHIRRFQ